MEKLTRGVQTILNKLKILKSFSDYDGIYQ